MDFSYLPILFIPVCLSRFYFESHLSSFSAYSPQIRHKLSTSKQPSVRFGHGSFCVLLWGGSHRKSQEEMHTIDLDFLSSTGVRSDYALIHHPCWVQINPARYCLCSADCLFDFIKVEEDKKNTPCHS